MKDQLKLHFIVFLWGFTGVLGALITIPAVEMVFYRTGLAAVFLLALLLVKKRTFKIKWRSLLKLLGTGILVGMHWVSFFASIKVSKVSICLAGIATCTLFTALLEPLIKRYAVKWYEVLLGFVIIGGLYVIFRFEFDHVLGLGLALLAAFLAALFSILNSNYAKVHPPLLITFYEMIGACLFTILFFPVYSTWLSDTGSLQLAINLSDGVYLLVLSLVCTVYAFYISVEIMKRISAFNVNLSINMEPVYGIVLAAIILGEHDDMSQGFYLGAAIILAAVLIYPVLNHYLPKWDRKRAADKKAEKAALEV